MPRTRWVGFDLRNAFLGPVEISLDLFGGFHAVGKIGTCAFEASLSERLQLEELLLFGVEGAGSVFHSSIAELNRLHRGRPVAAMVHPRLRLSRETPIQRQWIDCAAETIVHQFHKVDTGCSAI